MPAAQRQHQNGALRTTYAQNCIDGEVRIFSLTDQDDHQVATMEIRHTPDQGWQNRQIRGPKNHQVTEQTSRVGHRIAEMYQAAYSEKLREATGTPHTTCKMPATPEQIELTR